MEEEDINLIEYFQILLKWRRLIAFASLFLTVGGLLVVYTKTPHYRATVVVQPENNRSDAGEISGQMDPLVMGEPWEEIWASPSLIDTIEAVLQSRTIAERVIDRWNLVAFFLGGDRNDPAQMEAAVRKLKTQVKFVRRRGEKKIIVQVVLTDPQLAQAVANEFVIQFQRMVDEGVVWNVEKQRLEVQKGLERVQRELFESAKKLGVFFDSGRSRPTDWEPLAAHHDVLGELAADLVLQNERTQVDEGREVSLLKVIDWARLPEEAYWPNRKLHILLSFLGGILGALLLGYLAEYVQRYGLLTRVIAILRQEGPRENF